MKRFLQVFLFIFAVSAGILMTQPREAQATMYQFDVINHPNWNNFGGQGNGGVFLVWNGWQVFGFVDVKVTFDTATESGRMAGSILHHNSSELWNLEYIFSDYKPVVGTSFENEIMELINPANAGGWLEFLTADLTITPTVANPTYQGPTSSAVRMHLIFRDNHYRTGFTGGSGWFASGGDLHSGITNGHVVPSIPEPGTFALMGLGLGAAVLFRRRKKA